MFRPLQERLSADVAGRYRVVREVGRGSSAVVYLARDEKHRREVALKVLDPMTAPASGAARFHQEIALLARLQHPHILPLFDSGEAAGSLYFVTPYVRGESLRSRLTRGGPLPPADALRVAAEVAGALAHAHAHGVVHRDVKPENVLLTEDAAPGAGGAGGAPNGAGGWHALVCDFGIARRLLRVDSGDVTPARTHDSGGDRAPGPGTLAYMAPEQADGGAVDARADVWAVGLVLYEMLAGRLPHADAPSSTLARLRRYGGAPRAPRVPGLPGRVRRRLDALFARALAPEPAARYADARDLAAVLADAQAALAARYGWRALAPETEGGRWAAALALAAVAAGAGVAARRAALGPAGGAAGGGPVAVALVPFAGEGAPAERRSLDALLAQAVEALPGVRAVGAAGLAPPGGPLALNDLQARARALGARYYAVPSAGQRGRAVDVALDVYAVADGARVLRASAGGDAADPAPGVGRVAMQALRAVAARERLLDPARAVLMTATSSAFALAHLVQGQRSARAANHEAAAEEFARAVRADSACALAYHRLSVALVSQHQFPAALAAVDAGLARRARLEPEWVTLLEAQRHYVRREAGAAAELFQRSVADRPGNVDGWLGLGETLYHYGWFSGQRAVAARAAFDAVVRLDSTFAPVDDHVLDLAVYAADSAAATRALARIAADYKQRPAREALVALAFGAPAARAAALRRLAAADRYTLTELFAVLSIGGYAPALADTVATFLADPSRSPGDRLRGAQLRLLGADASGGWPARLAALRREAADTALDPWLATAALAGHPDGGALAGMRRRAAARVRTHGPPSFAQPYWDDTRDAFLLLAHHAATAGNSADVRALERTIARSRSDSSDPVLPAIRAALAARRALLAGDTASAVRLLGRGLSRIDEPFATFSPLRAMGPERALLVELLAATDPGGADLRRWVTSFTASRALADRFFADRVRRAAARAASARAHTTPGAQHAG